MTTVLIVVLVIAVAIFLWSIGIFNKLIAMIEAINNNQRQIDIQLDRRFKVFE
jgi:LemA protein